MTPLELIRSRKIVAIVRGLSPQYLVRLGHALEEGGIGLMEVTYDQRNPETWQDTASGIEALTKEFGDRLIAGAGTVIRPEQVTMTYNAGGRYLVTPTTQPEIIRTGKALGLGIFPGAMTPSEILTAFEAGADAVKVFPASVLGPGYIKAVRAPLSHIPLMAVGGVNEKNAADFMKAGCVGLGVGGNLVNKEWIQNGEWDKITALAGEYRKAVADDE
ncbi:MAG: bifunctional 4-hydroxy-2-oxoglutarate aldolase/2-dehydro-3-deoxy-phosphogluconate aldolase [Oscillospiraceae bacterium]|nr:bifunctional 4-hydroxy-2-oxoglutarate aldolase/2-dehydro-3-deoxy-phosphogluconate aldolase [Oscillospiraceae bacterium]